MFDNHGWGRVEMLSKEATEFVNVGHDAGLQYIFTPRNTSGVLCLFISRSDWLTVGLTSQLDVLMLGSLPVIKEKSH